MVTASKDGTARVWDVGSGKEVHILKHEEAVDDAGFSTDGERIVTASEDNVATVWDAVSGLKRASLDGHDQWVNSARFNKDGTRIVTASKDETARLWDAESGRAIAILAGHAGEVESAAFSPDGSRVVTASDDKTARVWDVSAIPKGDIRQVACKLLNWNFSLDSVTPDLKLDGQICVADPDPTK